MRTNTKTLLSNTTLAGTTPVFSEPIDLENVYCLALHTIAVGASVAGSLQIQGSNQQGRDEQGGEITSWANIGTATTLTTAGSLMLEKDAVGFKWFRVSFTPNNGTGTLSVILSTKGS